MMAGDITFLGCRIAFKGTMEWGEREAGQIIYQSLFGQVEIYTPLAARVRA
jgi:hypothetical protein